MPSGRVTAVPITVCFVLRDPVAAMPGGRVTAVYTYHLHSATQNHRRRRPSSLRRFSPRHNTTRLNSGGCLLFSVRRGCPSDQSSRSAGGGGGGSGAQGDSPGTGGAKSRHAAPARTSTQRACRQQYPAVGTAGPTRRKVQTMTAEPCDSVPERSADRWTVAQW